MNGVAPAREAPEHDSGRRVGGRDARARSRARRGGRSARPAGSTRERARCSGSSSTSTRTSAPSTWSVWPVFGAREPHRPPQRPRPDPGEPDRERQPDGDRIERPRAERPGGQVRHRRQGEQQAASRASPSPRPGRESSRPRPGRGRRRRGRPPAPRAPGSAGARARPRRRLDVVGHDVVALVEERPRLGDAQQRDARARARAEVEPRIGARVPEQRDDVAVEALLDEDPPRIGGDGQDLGRARDGLERLERRARSSARSASSPPPESGG